MRKLLTLLAVAIVMADSTGCCCRRLCPFLDRGAPCGCCLFPQPTYTPVVAAPCPPSCPPATMAPQYMAPQQYVVPSAQTVMPQSLVAAPVATQPCCPQPCAPACPPQPCCTKWDPCQCAVVAQPQPNCCPQPACCPQPQAAGCCAPQSLVFAEPSCAYVDAGCCEGPLLGSAAYGCESGCCGIGGCEAGCCGGGVVDGGAISGQVIEGGAVTEGGATTVPAPETYTDPQPAAE